MGTTLVLAWRNIWRNTRRTLITAAAIGVGLAMLVFTIALVFGMHAHLVDVATGALVGDAQIHAPEWRATRDETLVVPDAEATLARLRGEPSVRAASPRVWTTGLLAVGDRSAPVQVLGVDPELERTVTTWPEHLVAGGYLAEDDQVLLGRDLAEELDVEVGTRLALTVADAATGDMNGAAVRVVGILYAANETLDDRTAILPLPAARRLVGLPGAVHEIALRLELPPDAPPEAVEAALAPVRAGLGSAAVVEPWPEILPVVAGIMELQDVYLLVTGAIVFAIVALGIMNTLSMSLLERTHEFGVLRALGTAPARLAALVLTEAGLLGALGSVTGVGLGLLAQWPFAEEGLQLTESAIGDVDLATRIVPVLDAAWIGGSAVVFVLLTVLVALIVAVRAARIQPATALREP